MNRKRNIFTRILRALRPRKKPNALAEYYEWRSQLRQAAHGEIQRCREEAKGEATS